MLKCLEANDIPKFAKFLSKSQAIISELMLTLDHEKGGNISKELERLYDFMLYYLTEANLEKNPQKIERVIKLLETIANAYRDIVSRNPELSSEVASESSEKSTEDTAANPQPTGSFSVSF